MNHQEIFDKVATHLIQQNKKSVRKKKDTDGKAICLYRGPGNLKCAAGCLISDDEYVPEMEGIVASHALRDCKVMHNSPHTIDVLVDDLQQIHDSNSPSRWPAKLRAEARARGLNYDSVTKALEART